LKHACSLISAVVFFTGFDVNLLSL